MLPDIDTLVIRLLQLRTLSVKEIPIDVHLRKKSGSQVIKYAISISPHYTT